MKNVFEFTDDYGASDMQNAVWQLHHLDPNSKKLIHYKTLTLSEDHKEVVYKKKAQRDESIDLTKLRLDELFLVKISRHYHKDRPTSKKTHEIMHSPKGNFVIYQCCSQ